MRDKLNYKERTGKAHLKVDFVSLKIKSITIRKKKRRRNSSFAILNRCRCRSFSSLSFKFFSFFLFFVFFFLRSVVSFVVVIVVVEKTREELKKKRFIFNAQLGEERKTSRRIFEEKNRTEYEVQMMG